MVSTVLLRGRSLDAAPVVAAAFAAAELSADLVDLLLGAQAGREAIFARDEQLLDQARELRAAQLAKVVAYWRHRADAELNADGPEPPLPAPTPSMPATSTTPSRGRRAVLCSA